MKLRKVVLTASAAALAAGIAAAGSLAYLQKESAVVTNTFVASGGGEIVNPDQEEITGDDEKTKLHNFDLKEHLMVMGADGRYTKADSNEYIPGGMTGTGDDGNAYKVTPGVDLPKDPFIHITQGQKTEVPAYLYVEIVDGLAANNSKGLSYDVGDDWIEVTGVTGKNQGKIYVYGSSGAATIVDEQTTASADLDVPILKDNVIRVADNNAEGTGLVITDGDESTAGDAIDLQFYGYIAQESAVGTDDNAPAAGTVAAAAKVYQNCFGE